MADKDTSRPNAPTWLKVAVVLHLLCITIWALPNPSEPLIQGKRAPVGTEYLLVWNHRHLKNFQPVQAYLFTTGFWQYWDMFSPNPAQKDMWCDAIVTYKDGTKERYQYPRVYLMSLAQKFVGERYRKFYERVDQPKYAYIWPQFAQRIALINDDPANPPVKVSIRRHWLIIPSPELEPKVMKISGLLAVANDPATDKATAKAAREEADALIKTKPEKGEKALSEYFPHGSRKADYTGYKGQPYGEFAYFEYMVDQQKLAKDRKGLW